MFFIYIAHSKKVDKFYIGYSKNPWARIIQHQESKKEKFTAMVEDWTLEAVFEVSEIEADAIYLVRFIKKQKSIRLTKRIHFFFNYRLTVQNNIYSY